MRSSRPAEKHRRIDVLGVVVIGLAVALGGSLIRDLVLNQPPVVVWMNWYLLVAGASAILGMVLQPVIARADWLITVLDAVVMGLFGAIAASKALSLGVGEAGALVVGVIGAIGGGMLRDVILNLPLSFLHVGTLYAVAAAAGIGALILLVALGTPDPRSRVSSASSSPRSCVSPPFSSAGPSPNSVRYAPVANCERSRHLIR